MCRSRCAGCFSGPLGVEDQGGALMNLACAGNLVACLPTPLTSTTGGSSSTLARSARPSNRSSPSATATSASGSPTRDPGVILNGFHETWPIVYPEDAYGMARTGQTTVNVTDGSIIRLLVDDEPLD